jgi:hypothetical protein
MFSVSYSSIAQCMSEPTVSGRNRSSRIECGFVNCGYTYLVEGVGVVSVAMLEVGAV